MHVSLCVQSAESLTGICRGLLAASCFMLLLAVTTACCLLLHAATLLVVANMACSSSQGTVSSLLSFLSHQTGQTAQKRRPCVVMDGRAGRTEEGAKTSKLIGHLSQTTSATGEGKYGSCMQAEPPNASWMQPDPLSWMRPRRRVYTHLGAK